jgi:glycyl-tRNA synthetase beta chain
METQSVLMEIGVEEVPARFLPGAVALLKTKTEETLRQERIAFKEIRTYATPRRLAMIAEGIPPKQEERVSEVFGPPRHAAFTPEGAHTKAALGFAASHGVRPEELVVRTRDKGEYVAAVVKEEGLPVGELLPGALRKIVLSLNFPKSMRWGSGTLRFVRPIHWILALYGEETVSFDIDGIRSGNTSRGHRFLSPGEFRIKDIGEYQRVLERNSVVVDQERRKEMIEAQARDAASTVGGAPVEDEELLATVVNLTEYPVAVLGEFPAEYLDLPEELLTAVMKGHQKYIPVKDEVGGLKNYFVVVSNTRRENAGVVKAGAERVIRARFEDARFYYEEDRERRLADRLEDLRKVTYQEKLGSLHDKTMRLALLAEFIAEAVCPEEKDKVWRAAELSKADLLTGVVREFPELQGVMGMYYALKDGEDRAVALALREQYLPAYSGDRLPSSEVGAVLSLADRVEGVASFFAIGLTPTGSEDPFALRRQALAAIAILTERGYGISIKEMVRTALASLAHIPGSDRAEAAVLRFFEQRLEPLLASRDFTHDLIQSVISFSTGAPLREVMGRLDALRDFKEHPDYTSFLVAVKRVRNILPDRDLPPVDDKLFREEDEEKLKEALDTARFAEKLVTEGKYFKAVDTLVVTLTEPVNLFFNTVLVMDKDEAVRDNRLSLLKEIWGLVSQVADFSKLSETA